ncbi:uncharacterized protein LOC121538013 isoform X1 [Coregonus clupeaformis]|uniref:uncharacterized protein LOC121538013 isoform X1 n=1 Tax=Coregonus clupeaformis TaxID=59861 RepID=UPI001BE09F4A|nr:uncharacterized protein LOC121538013 isoform X1 [Coregonus clupeaformis]
MAVSMRRMNGSWRGMTLALVLCALLLHNGVQGDYPTDASAVPETGTTDVPSTGAADTTVLTDATYSSVVTVMYTTATPQAPVDDTATTVADYTVNATTGSSAPGSDQDTAFTSMVPKTDPLTGGETSGTTAGPGVDTQGTEATDAPVAPVVPETEAHDDLVNPTVECVDKEAVKDKDAVKVELLSKTTCSETKRILEDSAWCTGDCNLQVFQEENSNTLVLTRAYGGVKELSESLISESIKGQLGVVEAAPQLGTHSPIVLVSLLITGLLLAAALIGCYCIKNNRGHNAKGMRLAEEAYPVDEENQGNTLVSVAPLNPPETLEKPANGDSQEAAKTQPPPTNGHSTTKTADTEL